jgi:diguanylate cyclase (GGDEF)-like protein/PAS domain S-box-containing protein
MNMLARKHEFFVENDASGFDADLGVYKTLLESTQAIPWKIDWATMQFAYIGPQIEPLLGWSQESWATVDDWASRMHPDDREQAVSFCVAQSLAGVDHEMDYRALTKDNGYVWIRDVVHVVRNDAGEVDCLVGFMFDISERKEIEQKLSGLQKELEVLSFEDGLTGIANRRIFDTHLDSELKAARRARKPLSLIMLDIDHFKQYNDHYGHIQGDDCLKQVGAALKSIGARPRDIVARYGGEEFVVLLPETSAAAALKLAQQCRNAIAGLGIAHAAPGCGPCVTASIGVGTITPKAEVDPKDFIHGVDRLLYAAKEAGRDRIEAGPV